ncbi:MAG: hypothetical protein P1V20_09640 [Verrucomicrobiales bacterium]|nr:hypothetical protein [Verrucomicrobiales bacterium]
MISDTTQSGGPISSALNMLKRIRRLDGSALISAGRFLHDDFAEGSDTTGFLQATLQLFDAKWKKGLFPKEILLSFPEREVLFLPRYPVILCLFFQSEEELQSIKTGGNQFLNRFGPMLGAQEQPKAEPYGAGESEEKFRQSLTLQPGEYQPKAPLPKKAASLISLAISQTLRPDNINEQGESPPEVPGEEMVPVDVDWPRFLCATENLFTKVMEPSRVGRLISAELDSAGLSGEAGLEKSQYLSFGTKLTSRIRDRKIRRLIENELESLISNL